MNKPNQEIIDQFDFFNDLVYKEKIILDNNINLQPKKITFIGLLANQKQSTVQLVKILFLWLSKVKEIINME